MAAGVAAPVLRKEYPVRVLSPPRTCATNVGWPEPLRQSTCSAGSANILHETAHVPNRSTTTSVTSGLVAHTAAVEDVEEARDDAIHRCLAGRTLLLPELPVGELGDDVKVSEVASVFLDQMEQDAFECCGVGTVPAGTWFAHLG